MAELRHTPAASCESQDKINFFGLELTGHLLITLLVSGSLAMVGFDLFGQSLSPMAKDLGAGFIGAKLAPVGLATQTVSKIFGVSGKAVSGYGIGHAVHVLTGLLIYPLGFVIFCKLIVNAGIKVHWTVGGAIYGIILFVFALYFVAHIIAGNKPFLGWVGITWAALWGHIIYGLILAAVVHYRDDRHRPARTSIDT